MNLIKGIVSIIKGDKVKESNQEYCDSLVFNNDGKLLLLRRSQSDEFQPGKWSLPGGKLEEGETTLIGALRELCEETNIVVDPFSVSEDCFLEAIKNDDGSLSYYYAFSLKTEEEALNIVLDIEEHYEWKWVYIWEIGKYNFIFDLGSRIMKFYNENIDKLNASFVDSSLFKIYEDEYEDSDTFLDSLLDSGAISDGKYLLMKANISNSIDGSKGGKLIKVSRVDKNGKKVTKWIKPEDVNQEKEKNIKNDSEQKKKTYTSEELAEYAKNTSRENLENSIKSSSNPQLREAAHIELDRRKGEEHIEEKVEDKKQKDTVKEDETNNVTNKKITYDIDSLKEQYKEAMENNDFDKLVEIGQKLAQNSKILQQESNLGVKNIEKVPGEEKMTQNFTDEQENALNEYVSIKYKQINEELRTGDVSKENEKIVSSIMEAMEANKLKNDVVVFRGEDASNKKGDNKAFTSTTLNENTANSFARGENPTVKRYLIPKGTPSAYIGGGEKELLLPIGFNLNYHELKVEEINGDDIAKAVDAILNEIINEEQL